MFVTSSNSWYAFKR
ncbi:uncharacterized protein FFB20_15040 [Fusarium fujikuroi]|nr:uncharacterized protein FFE2_05089 [Fusarium fujikuroi]SCN84443.1 uncharacterized protein FFC1_04554 [Fusarium fujikuroi]SCO16656.1 uncharacterized protein FFB20_15040 [Fusarium fujikuroi]SCO34633.1 uncharacterized protein FFNC_03947 [Fusarium fujikuroi]SCV35323.1 uncharacterized protein FFB14_05475 [Fusarium fujikuroi]